MKSTSRQGPVHYPKKPETLKKITRKDRDRARGFVKSMPDYKPTLAEIWPKEAS